MKGFVTKAIGGFFYVADEKENIYQTRIRGRIRDTVYPGDYVEFNEEIIEKVYPRKNLLHRPAIANVDQVLILLSVANPEFDRRLLDRFLIIVEKAGLNPLIVINKIDLAEEGFFEQFEDYRAAGYQVYFISVKQKQGIDELMRDLGEHINVLTGPSGVGKSSLINELVAEERMKVGEISKRLKRGVHTTRHVEFLAVENRGWVADTPGFTSLEIKHIQPEELTYFYPEFTPYLDRCKFRGCSHTHEPVCAVKDAVADSLISAERYDSYRNFYNELQEG
ncbi:MAG: ribosome small subunit-dependent GTPase A [Halanaerobiaceae bacterium]|nr:ribosome small subunit-dependent GTPase A [Halanaerobiaceae bacterium]